MNDIAAQLLADWAPWVPRGSQTLLDWIPLVLEATDSGPQSEWCVRQELGLAERQWRGFASWMLGVACARMVLAEEDYEWIAPVSAFSEKCRRRVAVQEWPYLPPRGNLITKPASSSGGLQPDYVAVRGPSSAEASVLEWAIAEAKGTCRAKLSSSRDWRRQVRNVEVWRDGKRLDIPRRLVIATRVRPDGDKGDRRLNVRAWNAEDKSEHLRLSVDDGLDVAAVELFGFLRNIGLSAGARAIQLAAQGRSGERMRGVSADPELDAVWEELTSIDLEAALGNEDDPSPVEVDGERVTAVVVLSPHLKRFLNQMMSSEVRRDELVNSWREFRREHAAWRFQQAQTGAAVLHFGATVSLEVSR